MRFKRLSFLALALVFLTPVAFCQESSSTPSDQQINDFSLAGYGDKGKKSWDLAGKSADIFTEVIKLKDVVGNLYGKEEDVRLTAQEGDFHKVEGRVHLEKDVVIATSTGTTLTTNSLDWDRKAQTVTTQDLVNIERQNMVLEARGAKGEPNLKRVALEKEVTLDIYPENPGKAEEGRKEKTTITCDGPLEIDYQNNIATFNNNVKVERPDSTIYSDKMDVYFIPANKEEKETQGPDKEDKDAALMGNKIDKIIARGNVRVFRGENVSYSEEAIYTAADKKLVLNGRPQLIIYSTEELKDASLGN